VAAENLRSYVRDSDPFRYWKEGCILAAGPMVVIIRKIESEEGKAALYQEAEGLLFDIIGKSEEHFGADSFEAGHAVTCILFLRRTYCPVEPATSTIEVAMRAYGIYSRMTQKESRAFEYYRDFTQTAQVIVEHCVDVASGKITAQIEEMRLLQAADFLVKEARKSQKILVPSQRSIGGLDVTLDAIADRLNQLMRKRA
jgi:hypothetical protein